MNEKFITRSTDKDGISLCSINKSMKGVKIVNKIDETGYYNIHR